MTSRVLRRLIWPEYFPHQRLKSLSRDVFHARRFSSEPDGPPPEHKPVLSSYTKKRFHREFRSLDPRLIRSEDYVKLSGVKQPTVNDRKPAQNDLPGSRQPPAQRFRVSYVWFNDSENVQRSKPFPPNTHGFFYYTLPRNRPPAGGEVRFRLTPDADVANFALGEDLMLPNHPFPWRITLWHIASRAVFEGLRTRLLRDALVDRETIEFCAREFAAMPMKLNSQILYSLDDTRYIRCDAQQVRLFVCGDHLYSFTINNMFSDSRGAICIEPYTGSAICRLERATPPSLGWYLRFVRIVGPIQCRTAGYDGYISPPKEGELLTRGGKPYCVMPRSNDGPPLTLARALDMEDLEAGRQLS